MFISMYLNVYSFLNMQDQIYSVGYKTDCFSKILSVNSLVTPEQAECDATCGNNGNSQVASGNCGCPKVDLVCVNQQQVATVTASSEYSAKKSFGPDASCIGQQVTDTVSGKFCIRYQFYDKLGASAGED